MNSESKKPIQSDAQNGQRKPWVKPVVLSAPIRDYTEDGYLTGSDNGIPANATAS